MWDGVKGRDGEEKKQRRVRVGRQRKALFYFNGAVSWAARTETKPPLRPATFVIQTPRFDTTTTGFRLIPYSWEIFLIRSFCSPLSSLFPYSAANLGGWIRDYSTCANYRVSLLPRSEEDRDARLDGYLRRTASACRKFGSFLSGYQVVS